MTKVIRIVEDNRVTGVVYGEININDEKRLKKQYDTQIQQTRKAQIKQISRARTKQK